jgi:7-cyano-7-deazaguanine reductase
MSTKTKRRAKNPESYEPKYLGKPATGPVAAVDLVPWTQGPILVSLDCAEFTTICPVTGQPDFGRLVIEYLPEKHIVETKSLKLYLQGYRDRKGFNEQIVASMADDLFAQMKPQWLKVTGYYNRRGGIAVSCTAERGRIPRNAPTALLRRVEGI